MPLKKDLGQWISHFEKSDAPQFKDKSKEERKDMALAAFRAKYGSLNEAYENTTNLELASYVGVLQNEIGAEKNPKKLAMLKQDLEDVKNELKKRKSVNEDFAKFDTLKMAINQHEKGEPYYDKTRLINIFNQLDNPDQERAKKEYSEYFGKSVNESNGFKSGKEFINIKLQKYPKAVAKINQLISIVGESNFTMEMAEWLFDFFNNAHFESPMNEATKDEETTFHKKLDKLVHDTFGKRKGELEEKADQKQNEAAKPDFLDVDKDRDKKETMKKALRDKAMKKIKEVGATTYAGKASEDDVKKDPNFTTLTGDAKIDVLDKLKKGGTVSLGEVLNEGHKFDYEGKMAQSQLLSIVKNARDLFNMMDEKTQLKSWVQSKLTKAEDYLDAVRTYLEGEALSSTVPAMFENGRVSDETGTALSIGDVVKGGDGRIYQIVFSASEGKPSLVPFDLKRRKITTLRNKVYFDDQESSVPKKLNKVMDFSATKGGFMN
jgi:hypothetical protein